MLEVELKFRISQPSIIISKLEELNAEYIDEVEEIDYYLQHPCRDFRESDEALRIRVRDSICIITYKGPRFTDKAKVRSEYETRVTDFRNILNIFNSLGFRNVAIIRKKRTLYRVKDFKVSIDDVHGLGYFIEIEAASEDVKDLYKLISKIEAFAVELGLDPSKKIVKTYLELYLEADRYGDGS